MLLHIGTFHFNDHPQHLTPWHALAPRTRVLCTLLSVFAIALTPNGYWWTWAIYSLGIFGLIQLSQVNKTLLLKRITIEFAFIGVVLFGTLFREGGEVVWAWGIFKITTVGLTVLGSVILKALLSLTMLNVLTLTTSIPALLNALLALKIPPLLVAILASMYRHINVLMGEFQTMRRAALSRNLTLNKRWQRQVIGNMMGSLFIRTYERGEQIHQAMSARGYQGIIPVEKSPVGGWRDVGAVTLTFVVGLLGQGIYLL